MSTDLVESRRHLLSILSAKRPSIGDDRLEPTDGPLSPVNWVFTAPTGSETNMSIYQSFLDEESRIRSLTPSIQGQTIEPAATRVAASELSSEMSDIADLASTTYGEYIRTDASIKNRYNSALDQASKNRDAAVDRAEKELRNAQATATRSNTESKATNKKRRSEAEAAAKERRDHIINDSPEHTMLVNARTRADKENAFGEKVTTAGMIGGGIAAALLGLIWFISGFTQVGNPIGGFLLGVVFAVLGVIVGGIAGGVIGAIVGLIWAPISIARNARLRSQDLLRAEDAYKLVADNAKSQYTSTMQLIEESFNQRNRTADGELAQALGHAQDAYGVSKYEAIEQYEGHASTAAAELASSIEALNAQCVLAGFAIRERSSKLSRQILDIQQDWSSRTHAAGTHTASACPLVHLGTGRLFAGMNGSDLVIGTLPIVVDAPYGLSMVFRQNGPGYAHVPETFLLRLMASFPPGKLRLTLVDPVGLGRNVASLMALADHDPYLISDRAWVEPRHIEQQLAALSEQMQTIIQKYLKREFESMEEYNRKAGNVEEPYRVLVVNNFPANLNSEALRHLINIMTVGPRCGVYTLLSIDDTQKRPYDFNIDDIINAASMVVQQVPMNGGDYYSIRDLQMHTCMVQFEPLPSTEVLKPLMANIGKQALKNSIVQVPFAETIPARSDWWESKSEDRIAACVGFHGARKNLMLTLGKNDKDEDLLNSALVVGRVGSGKSNLLHVLIMSLALKYSPEELQFYLIDSKQGVEFKTYAVHQLPHALAISVETEREFIFSVLKRLDAELEERGEKFRKATEELGESANIAKYRKLTGDSMPRILLIADEFQELFSEDDALARTSTILLEKLVRQGRAYGIHIMLSTQSLAGGHGLNNQTKGLMALRIALMSSEADSRLILSDDNPEARLLNRPGEAIYNDKFGELEGNHRFQTSWLTTEQRDIYLDQLSAMAGDRWGEPIVFEGNRPAEIKKNRRFGELFASDELAVPPIGTPIAWLGEPVAISDPTGAPLPRQGGGNLLIVGQDEETAYNMLATSLIGLARHHELVNDGARFHLVDLGPVDSAYAKLLQRVRALFPDQIAIAQRRRLVNVVDSVYRELERRLEQDDDRGLAPIYLVIASLQRARDLREQDDYASFPAADDEPSVPPHDQFMKIIREGPDVAIHLLTWCDTLNNAVRAMERRGLGEFDAKVLMQMSPDDSGTLIDSRDAAKLGGNRALLYSEDRSTLEKFRPYGRPSDELLAKVENRHRPVMIDIVPDGSAQSTSGSVHEVPV